MCAATEGVNVIFLASGINIDTLGGTSSVVLTTFLEF